MNKSGIAAVLLFIGVVVWISLGKPEQPQSGTTARLDAPLQRVQVERLSSRQMNQEIKLSGTTAANRTLDIRAQIKSNVESLKIERGNAVSKGQVLITLDRRDWPAKVAEAKALFEQRQLELRSTEKLFARDLVSKNQLAAKRTDLASARAKLRNAEENLNSTTIKAPFDGFIEQQHVELGDAVQDGSSLLKLIDLSPLIITSQIPEQRINDINVGDSAYAILPDGRQLNGTIRFIAAQANSNTRAYEMELEVSQYNGRIASGLTAAIYIPQPAVDSYFLSPALLLLNETGQLSVKTLTEDDRVTITPVKLLRAENNGIWVYGPSESLNLIVMGHGFVDENEQVQAVYASSMDGE